MTEDSPLAQLVHEWDTIRERAFDANRVLTNPDVAYREHNAANAQLLREGQPLPLSNLKGEAKATLAAAKIARPQVIAAIASHFKSERGVDPRIRITDHLLSMDSRQLVAAIETAFTAEESRAPTPTPAERRAAYDHAMRAREEAIELHIERGGTKGNFEMQNSSMTSEQVQVLLSSRPAAEGELA
jgi:hypothetical protein